MNQEKELLAEAERRFPINTSFVCLNSGSRYKVRDHTECSGGIYSESHGCGGGNMYKDGVWAEIVSYPEGHIVELKESYPIY